MSRGKRSLNTMLRLTRGWVQHTGTRAGPLEGHVAVMTCVHLGVQCQLESREVAELPSGKPTRSSCFPEPLDSPSLVLLLSMLQELIKSFLDVIFFLCCEHQR